MNINKLLRLDDDDINDWMVNDMDSDYDYGAITDEA